MVHRAARVFARLLCQLTENIKSAYVVLPVDVKFAAQRFRNVRPYLVTGIMPTFDVTKRRSEYLKLKSTDFYLSVGFGCDFYLPYFKLNPVGVPTFYFE